jgi:hypothetical protein
MKMSVIAAGLGLAGALFGVPVMAQTASDPAVLNAPGIQFWNVYGAGQTSKAHKDKDVQGGMALKITIPKATENAWDIGASVPITGAYKKGDQIVVVIYARLVSDDPLARLEIPATVQIASPPYTGIIPGKLLVSPVWQPLTLIGTADADYAGGQTNVALSLGGPAKTLDFGPVFILNQGQKP